LHGWALFGSRPDDERVARDAIQQLTKSMERDGRSPSAPYYLGCIYRHQGKDRTARQLFMRALDRDSGYVAAQRALQELSKKAT